MTSIDEILKGAGFVDWSEEEKKSLSILMHNLATKNSNSDVIDKTDRVLTTFIKILDTHLPEKEV